MNASEQVRSAFTVQYGCPSPLEKSSSKGQPKGDQGLPLNLSPFFPSYLRCRSITTFNPYSESREGKLVSRIPFRCAGNQVPVLFDYRKSFFAE